MLAPYRLPRPLMPISSGSWNREGGTACLPIRPLLSPGPLELLHPPMPA